jgi:hypothetical protein
LRVIATPERYAAWHDRVTVARERPLFPIPRRYSELEIQAHWFAGDFGRDFRTVDGDTVRIVQFGIWNHEAGPDFAEAAISINGSAARGGCIELDMDARDWERHGHAENPNYDHVILHVCLQSGSTDFFTRTAQHRLVPRVVLDMERLLTEPPNPLPEAKPGRCVSPLRELTKEKVCAVLLEAAQFRLRRKAASLAMMRELHGADEALYQAIATTFGYKNNKLPFTVLAQRLPLRTLLASKQDIHALLFGVSGFLAATDLAAFEGTTRSYLRSLWEKWWPRRAEFGRLVIAPELWKRSGQRPANHPQRRLAALGAVVAEWSRVRALRKRCDPDEIHHFFAGLHDAYWQHHFTVASKATPRPMALVGEARVTDMLANVFYPLAVSEKPNRWDEYAELRAAGSNRRVTIAALRLFGESPLRDELLHRAAMQQGLLQIYEDFCMQDVSDCCDCPLPRQLNGW